MKGPDDRSWSLLIAQDTIDDPLFERSVVLVLEDEKDGAIGLILNKIERESPINMMLKSGLEGFLQLNKLRLFSGGPVDRDEFIIALWRDVSEFMGDITFGVKPEKAERILATNPAYSGAIFSGHCAWESGQLEAEIEEGIWLNCEVDLSFLNAKRPEGIWKKLFMRADPIFSKFPRLKFDPQKRN